MSKFLDGTYMFMIYYVLYMVKYASILGLAEVFVEYYFNDVEPTYGFLMMVFLVSSQVILKTIDDTKIRGEK